jgi:hypothetical protein
MIAAPDRYAISRSMPVAAIDRVIAAIVRVIAAAYRADDHHHIYSPENAGLGILSSVLLILRTVFYR